MGRKRKAESFLSCEEDVDDPSESVTSPGELIKYNIDTQTGYFKMDVLGPVASKYCKCALFKELLRSIFGR